jgi:nucleotide-binding universal stress UspA family protein
MYDHAKNGPVLLPIDGSEASAQAARHVAKTLAGTGIPVHLINVQRAHLPDPALFHAAPAIVATHRNIGHRLLRHARHVLAKHGITHTFEVAFGDAAKVIARTARRRLSPLIVMGTRGRHPLVNLLTGSVPGRVARLAPVPILLMRQGEKK